MKAGKWGPVVAWMALIFILSAQEQLPVPEQRWLDALIEKTSHSFEFGVLAYLLLRALKPEGARRWRLIGMCLLIAWLYALSDEFHQSFVPGRAADWSDVLFDWIGALVGAWIWQLRWTARRSRALSGDV